MVIFDLTTVIVVDVVAIFDHHDVIIVAQPTVRVSMARAAMKVGARSREELLERVASISGLGKDGDGR